MDAATREARARTTITTPARDDPGGPTPARNPPPQAQPTQPPAVEALLEGLDASLAEARGRLDLDPFANPIRLLGLELLRRLERGEIDEETLEALVRRLTLTAFRSRAGALRTYLGEVDPESNAARVGELLRAQTRGPDGDVLPFAEFERRVGRVLYGFVVTAHPTFGLTPDLQDHLVALALGGDGAAGGTDGGGEARRERALHEAARLPHRPPATLDLAAEHDLAMRAVRNLRDAVGRVRGIALDVAREVYPEDWRKLRPVLFNVASWVGYDTDGRADIGWGTTLAKRLQVQVDQLGFYRDRVAGLRRAAAARAAARGDAEPGRGAGPDAGPDAAATLRTLLELLEARLALGVKTATDEVEALSAVGGPDWAARLAKVSRDMAAAGGARLGGGTGELLGLVERALAAAGGGGAARELCLLRAELLTQGLTAARTHVRINALQLHNAIRKIVDMDHAPDDPAHRLTYLEAVTRLIDDTKPVTVNFGTIEAERTTAKRVFMSMAQMLKHLDPSEPVRFLIAECETPFTLLSALYFARLFGIADRIDISPLFETRRALERGASVVAEALSVASYRDYVRARGRICIQTGFSDAGRYMGQTAAAVAIERIRLDLARVLADSGLADLELVVFDTHGESIGRGAHPGGFADRLRYYDTPESRRRFAAAGVRLREESSYQGGDGYLFFLDPAGAFAAVTRALEHVLADTAAEEADDPFYRHRGYVDEFYAAVARFNAVVIDDPAYAAFLGFLGTNILFQTGSRPLKRQHEGAGPRAVVEHPSQLRAIPHNSILQQLGVLANTIGGVGQAVDKDPDAFRALYRESPRFRRLVSMVEHAFKFTDLDVVRGYLDLYDPEPWLRRAAASRDEAAAEDLRAVAEQLERIDLHDRLSKIFRVFQRDHTDLARALRTHRRRARDAGERPIAVEPATRDNLHALHALRLALIQRLMLRAVRVPGFSDRHAVTRDDLVARLMRLDVAPVLERLAEIFPVADASGPELDYGEPATYEGGEAQSYLFEHTTIFDPIARDYELIRRVGSGITHHLGAVG